MHVSSEANSIMVNGAYFQGSVGKVAAFMTLHWLRGPFTAIHYLLWYLVPLSIVWCNTGNADIA